MPLGYDPQSPSSQLTPRQILEQHPKGKAYARLLAGFSRYPLLCDAAGTVLSHAADHQQRADAAARREPELLRRRHRHRRAPGQPLPQRALHLAGRARPRGQARAGDASTTRTARPSPPTSAPQRVALDPEATARRIGVELSREDVVRHLEQMGHGVRDTGRRAARRGAGLPQRHHAPGRPDGGRGHRLRLPQHRAGAGAHHDRRRGAAARAAGRGGPARADRPAATSR